MHRPHPRAVDKRPGKRKSGLTRRFAEIDHFRCALRASETKRYTPESSTLVVLLFFLFYFHSLLLCYTYTYHFPHVEFLKNHPTTPRELRDK